MHSKSFYILWAHIMIISLVQFSSVAQSCPTLCDPMNHSTPGLPVHHQLPEVHSNSRPSSLWCHPAISSSIVPLSSCPQSLPVSESFPVSQLFIWGGQSTGVSALASFLPKNTQGWSPLGWTGWISLESKGLFKSLLQHYSSKASILRCSAFFTVQLLHPYVTTGKTIALTTRTFVGKVMSLLFNMLSAAAAAKSLQSCPTLCVPIDGSPSGSRVPGILKARTLEWVVISFSNAWKWRVKVKSLSRVRLLVTAWTAAHQAPPSMGFSRREYWSGVPLPSCFYIKTVETADCGDNSPVCSPQDSFPEESSWSVL